jgi:hypothetical protein
VALIAIIACSKPIAKLPQRVISGSLEPTVPATVITIQTVLQPQGRMLKHSIFIANGRARSDDELDRWRLFDLDQNSITYVDDVTKTYYNTPLTAAPAQQVIPTGAKRIVQGVEASQFLIRMGGYQRQLWIGSPQSIPPQLFGMMNPEFATLRGFPLLDHAELPYGKSKLVVDRNVVKIEQRNVPLSLLNVSRDYKSITAPAGSPPPASSPQRGRSTRATG